MQYLLIILDRWWKSIDTRSEWITCFSEWHSMRNISSLVRYVLMIWHVRETWLGWHVCFRTWHLCLMLLLLSRNPNHSKSYSRYVFHGEWLQQITDHPFNSLSLHLATTWMVPHSKVAHLVFELPVSTRWVLTRDSDMYFADMDCSLWIPNAQMDRVLLYCTFWWIRLKVNSLDFMVSLMILKRLVKHAEV